MPFHRAAALIILSCLVLAAPAAASERSEARRYAETLEPKLTLTPEQAETVVADYEARAAHVAATCLPDVRAAAKRERRLLMIFVLYGLHAFAASNAHQLAWLEAGNDQLAAVPTRSRALLRGRYARRSVTDEFARTIAATPPDFCAVVTAWRAKRFKGTPPGAEALFALFSEPSELKNPGRDIVRAVKLLRRHGARRAVAAAFAGEPSWPELREPARDPVIAALGMEPERDPGAGSRTPW